MKVETDHTVTLTAAEVLRAFKKKIPPGAELVGFGTPTRQDFDGIHDKELVMRFKCSKN